MTATSPVPDRVQVVPLGFEYARLREPVFEWKADKVVALDYDGSDADIPYIDELLAELRDNDRIALDVRECDIFDLYDTLGTVVGVIDEHPDDEVYVNISSGSKITAVAGTIACMATGATPIYAKPDYGADEERVPDGPLHDRVERIFRLPSYPIERPSATHVAFLAYIGERTDADASGRYRGASKKELIAFAEREAFPFVATSESKSRKGLYRLLDRHVVGPLREKGYVDVEQVGRTKYVSLTDDGRNTLRAFRPLLD